MLEIQERKLLDLIKYPIITDKTTKLLEDNQYCFAVNKKANKLDIKQAIEYLFNVKVKSINTCNQPTQKRTVGKFIGNKPNYKKAIITLKDNETINLFSED